MPGKVAWTKYKKKRPNETEEERKARIAKGMRKTKHTEEVSAMVPSRASCVEEPFAENNLFSIGLSIVALAFLALGMAGLIRTQGRGTLNVGAFGLCNLLVSLVAAWYGIRSFREKDKSYILARIGTGVGVVLILTQFVMISLGMRG